MKIRQGIHKGRGGGQGICGKQNQLRGGGKQICQQQNNSPENNPPKSFSSSSKGETKIFNFQSKTTMPQIRIINKPDIGSTATDLQAKLPALTAVADVEACFLCGVCKEVCLVGAISLAATVVVDGEKCFGCGQCVSACPADALSLINA